MPAPSSRSTLESFLDEYQLVRLIVSVAGLLLTGIFTLVDLWQESSPVPSLVVLGGIAGHSVWCRLMHVRTPRVMLAVDTSLLGLFMFIYRGDLAIITGVFAITSLVVVLFAERWWRIGYLAYLSTWFVAAFLDASGTGADSLASLFGSLLTILGIVVIMARVRGWLGRLDAERSQMVGTVSHELRNNLTGVLGITELLATTPGLDPTEVQDLLVAAHEQANDAAEIVEDLLTTSRLEATALTVTLGPVDINHEVSTVLHRLRRNDLATELADDLKPAWADSLRVRQVIRNLVTNAIRYGGSEIDVRTRAAGDSVQVIVRDNGEGVRGEEESTIFRPYRRSASTRTDTSSIGLGLWISQSLALAMRGHLAYRRRDGFTEFVLTLPVSRDRSVDHPVPPVSSDHV